MGRDEELATRRRFDHELRHLGNHVGMQPQFRLLDADDRRRIRMAEHCKQAEVAQTSVGEARGRHGVPQVFLVEEYLHSSAAHAGEAVRYRRLQTTEIFQQFALHGWLVQQVVQHDAEIRSIVQ